MKKRGVYNFKRYLFNTSYDDYRIALYESKSQTLLLVAEKNGRKVSKSMECTFMGGNDALRSFVDAHKDLNNSLTIKNILRSMQVFHEKKLSEFQAKVDQEDQLEQMQDELAKILAKLIFKGITVTVNNISYDRDDFIVQVTEEKEFEKIFCLAAAGCLVSDSLQVLQRKVAQKFATEIVSKLDLDKTREELEYFKTVM